MGRATTGREAAAGTIGAWIPHPPGSTSRFPCRTSRPRTTRTAASSAAAARSPAPTHPSSPATAASPPASPRARSSTRRSSPASTPSRRRAVQTTDGPRPHPGRRRERQDARPRAPGRLPRRREGRQALADPRGHVHEQGRARDARADRGPRRRAGRDGAMGTFHALCARILRRDGRRSGSPRFAIYDTDDQQASIASILQGARTLGPEALRPPRDPAARSAGPRTACSSRASSRRGGDPLRARDRRGLRGATRAALARGRRPRLRRPAHRGRPALRARTRRSSHHYQERWRYLHVDEYQDTNRAAVPAGASALARPTATSASSATTTSRSTRGAAPTCATSSTSSATTPTRPWSSSSRTTARRS